MQVPHIILASASPQRSALLRQIGVSFDVVPSGFDERSCTDVDPLVRCRYLATMKARDVASSHSGSIVIGCDTLVVAADGTLLEKPSGAVEARAMLERQSGSVSIVHSCLCIVDGGGALHQGVSSSTVRFKRLSADEIDGWIGTGLWKDRSGAFQIDGPGQLMIERIEGDFTSIVGLPIFLLGQLLQSAGVQWMQNSL